MRGGPGAEQVLVEQNSAPPHPAVLHPTLRSIGSILEVGSIDKLLKVVHSQQEGKGKEITYIVKAEVHDQPARVTVGPTVAHQVLGNRILKQESVKAKQHYLIKSTCG